LKFSAISFLARILARDKAETLGWFGSTGWAFETAGTSLLGTSEVFVAGTSTVFITASGVPSSIVLTTSGFVVMTSLMEYPLFLK
jgi:hypothetical protein